MPENSEASEPIASSGTPLAAPVSTSADAVDGTVQSANGLLERLRRPAVDRRTLLKYSAGLSGALVLPALRATPVQPGQATPAPTAQPQNGADTSRIQSVSGQALYTLPQDHQWHGGGIYATGLLQEWHYWTGFFTDDDTGEQFGLFYSLFREATSASVLGYQAWFSLANFQTQDFTWAVQVMDVPLMSTVPQGSTSPYDFQYSAQTADTSFKTTYLATPDTWSLQFKSVASSVPEPIGLDLLLTTQTPYGYLPALPMGVENENYPWNGQPSDPSTMYSLSYYYAGPKTSAKGTITVGDRVRRMTGSLWLEHQWGNYSFAQMPWTLAYIWSAFQFDDGSIFSFRQWYDSAANPIYNLGRYFFRRRMAARPTATVRRCSGRACRPGSHLLRGAICRSTG